MVVNAGEFWDIIDHKRGALSWETLADKVGLSKQTLLRMKKNSSIPTFDYVSRFASAIGFGLGQLYEATEPQGSLTEMPCPAGSTFPDCWWSIVDQIRSYQRKSWAAIGKALDVSDKTIVAAKNRHSCLPFDLSVRILEFLSINADAIANACNQYLDMGLPKSLEHEPLDVLCRRLTDENKRIVRNLVISLIESQK